jgi:hypothetical protein
MRKSTVLNLPPQLVFPGPYVEVGVNVTHYLHRNKHSKSKSNVWTTFYLSITDMTLSLGNFVLFCTGYQEWVRLKFWQSSFCSCIVQFWFDFLHSVHVPFHSSLGVGKTTLLLSARFRRIFIAIKQKNNGK